MFTTEMALAMADRAASALEAIPTQLKNIGDNVAGSAVVLTRMDEHLVGIRSALGAMQVVQEETAGLAKQQVAATCAMAKAMHLQAAAVLAAAKLEYALRGGSSPSRATLGAVEDLDALAAQVKL